MRKLVLMYVASFGFVANSLAQTPTNVPGNAVLVETVEAQPGKLIIPYKKYVYPNGLTLIVSEDHSDPVVHLNVTYHVGSARETRGKSGFAHFFEHMLFQGSKHVADEEHFKIIKQYGGDVNGNTTRDRTVYIETFPSNFTETALWMEADRMGFFLEAFTKKKFENQRSTVKNEKDERYNVPYGFLMEVKDQELYPKEHPYSWSTIGFVDDLDRADSSDLRNFFLRWYGPNNAAIILVGDVNTTEAVEWVGKYFGGIEKGPEVKKQLVSRVNLKENKYATFSDPNAFVPLVYQTYVGVPVLHQDEAALDMLSYLMGGTRSSILYKKFMDPEWALGASATNNPLSTINHELAGEFSFAIQGYPWSDVPQLQKMLNQAIDSFGIVGFSDDDLARAKSNILGGFSNGLEDVSNKANLISNFWYLDAKNAAGKSINLQDEYDRYNNVSKADIMRVYNTYIKGKNSSTVIIMPEQKEESEDENAPARKYVSVNPNADFKAGKLVEAEYNSLKVRSVSDNFDRTRRPEVKEFKNTTIPVIEKQKFSNGLELWSTYFNETPRVIVSIGIEGGQLLEDGKNFPYGTAEITADMMNFGTATKTPADLEKEFEKLGSNVSFNGGSTTTNITLSCEADKLDATIVLLQEMLFKPRWDEAEFKKHKKRVKQDAQNSLRNRSAGANNAWRKVVFGENIFGRTETESDYDKVTLELCKKYYNNYVPNLTKVIAIGPFTQQQFKEKFAFLESWKSNETIKPVLPQIAPAVQTPQLFGVDYPDADQTDLYIGFKSMPYDATGNYFKSSIMNFALAGNFNSRLNLDIREEKGWTYGIRGGFAPAYKNLDGYYSISAGVLKRATDSAVIDVIDHVLKYKNNGMTEDEFKFTKSALLASEALGYESIGQKAGYLANLANRGLDEKVANERTKIIQNITLKELNDLASTQFKTDQLMVLAAGDLEVIQPKLEALGMGKMQVLGKDGSGKIKYLKAGSTKLPVKSSTNTSKPYTQPHLSPNPGK